MKKMQTWLLTAALAVLSACTSNTNPTDPVSSSSGGDLTSNPNAKVRLGYLYTDSPENIASIDWSRFNHIALFTTLAPEADGSIYRYASYGNVSLGLAVWGDNSPFKAKYVNELKARGMKVLLVLGGAGTPSTVIAAACKDPTYRNNMVTQLVEMVNGTWVQPDGTVKQDIPLDGVDVDWEFPTTLAEKQCLTTMMSELRAALPTKLVTVATSYSTGYYDVGGLATVNLDWIGLMTYDYGQSGATQDHSPYGKAAQSAINWINAGIPASKLLLGVATYGRVANSTVDWKNAVGNPSYAPYFSNFDSTVAKANFIVDGGLKGVMYWELSQDSYGADLGFTQWIDNALKARGF